MARFYPDTDGDYVYDDEENDWDKTPFDCPLPCDTPFATDHEYCKAVVRRRLLDHVATPEKKEEPLDLDKFKKNWGFWLFRHPDTLEGDIGI